MIDHPRFIPHKRNIMYTYPNISMSAMTILTTARALTKALSLLVVTVLLSTFITGCGKSSKLKLGDRVETKALGQTACALTVTKVVKNGDSIVVTIVEENTSSENTSPILLVGNTTMVDGGGKGLGKPDIKKLLESAVVGGPFLTPGEKRILSLSYAGAKDSKAPYLIKNGTCTPPVSWEIDSVTQE